MGFTNVIIASRSIYQYTKDSDVLDAGKTILEKWLYANNILI